MWYTNRPNKALATKWQWYNCFMNTKEILYQLPCPETFKGGSSTIGLASFWIGTGLKDFHCFKISNYEVLDTHLHASIEWFYK
jgi:hypothetical protein